jgi:hypothetical protein
MNLRIANVNIFVDDFAADFILKHHWALKPTPRGLRLMTDIGYVGQPVFVPVESLLLGVGPEIRIVHRNGSHTYHRLMSLQVVQS